MNRGGRKGEGKTYSGNDAVAAGVIKQTRRITSVAGLPLPDADPLGVRVELAGDVPAEILNPVLFPDGVGDVAAGERSINFSFWGAVLKGGGGGRA